MSSEASSSLRNNTARTNRDVLIEGYALDEVLAFPTEQIDALLLCGHPLVLRVGSAEILCEARAAGERLTLQLAHIDGGGEGVLPVVWKIGREYARRRGCAKVEWIVHAVHCANPNLKLRRVLERLGFTVRYIKGAGESYYLEDTLETGGLT